MRRPLMTREDWDEALGDYFGEHDDIGVDGAARGPHLLSIEAARGTAPGVDDRLVTGLVRERFGLAAMLSQREILAVQRGIGHLEADQSFSRERVVIG